MKVFEKTDNKLRDFYTKVLENFGKEKMIQLLQLMKEFESVMRTEMEQMEDKNETAK